MPLVKVRRELQVWALGLEFHVCSAAIDMDQLSTAGSQEQDHHPEFESATYPQEFCSAAKETRAPRGAHL
jgi:hypothetical protein